MQFHVRPDSILTFNEAKENFEKSIPEQTKGYIMDINSKIAKFLRSGEESLTVRVSSATIRRILVNEYTNAGWEVTESGNEVTINLKLINEI